MLKVVKISSGPKHYGLVSSIVQAAQRNVVCFSEWELGKKVSYLIVLVLFKLYKEKYTYLNLTHR